MNNNTLPGEIFLKKVRQGQCLPESLILETLGVIYNSAGFLPAELLQRLL